MNGLDIILLYGPTWDQPGQLSKHHLARHWARTRKVLYVESPPNPLSFFTRREETNRLWQRYRHGPFQVAERLWVHTFFYPLPYRGRCIGLGGQWVNQFNQRVIRNQLQKVLKRLQFNMPILVVGSAHALPLAEHIPHSLMVYHCSDDFTQVPSFPESFPGLETELLRRCDLVICTAEELRRLKGHLNPNTITVPNGAQVEHFANCKAPDKQIASELVDLPKPIVGYIGSVFRWINQEWVAQAARQLPDWSFVFIGPLQTDISLLRKLSNVYFLGPRPYTDLPLYLRGFDVAIVPFVINSLTLCVSPIKFYEYLASGTPVVASRLPDLEPLSKFSYLVEKSNEFVQALQRAVSDETPEACNKRINESRNHSWANRCGEVDQIIKQAIVRKWGRGKN